MWQGASEIKSQLYEANIKRDRGRNQNRWGGGCGGGERVVLCRLLPLCVHYGAEEARMAYFVSALFCLPHPIWPTLTTHSQPTLRSTVRNRLKMQKQSSVLRARAQFCFFQRRLCGIKPTKALLDTSNQCNPQGLCWVFNEAHCSELESLSPRNGLTFFFLSFCFVWLSRLVGTAIKAIHLMLHLSLTRVTGSLLVHHGARINTLSIAHLLNITLFPFWIPPTHGFVHVRIILKTLVITDTSDRILNMSLSNLDTHTLVFYVSKTQVSKSKHTHKELCVCVCWRLCKNNSAGPETISIRTTILLHYKTNNALTMQHEFKTDPMFLQSPHLWLQWLPVCCMSRSDVERSVIRPLSP